MKKFILFFAIAVALVATSCTQVPASAPTTPVDTTAVDSTVQVVDSAEFVDTTESDTLIAL